MACITDRDAQGNVTGITCYIGAAPTTEDRTDPKRERQAAVRRDSAAARHPACPVIWVKSASAI